MKNFRMLTYQKISEVYKLDDISKLQAAIICSQLRIDLQTDLCICVAKLISINGNSEMTLDEINEEIRSTREKIDVKKKQSQIIIRSFRESNLEFV